MRLLLAVTATIAGVTAACAGSGASDGDAEAPSDDSGRGEEAGAPALGSGDGTFTLRQETFVDPTRDTAGSDGRSLLTDIYVPGGDGPFPLIMHAHGMAGSSDKFSDLLGKWAGAGYLVVAPNFPLTHAYVPEAQRDLGDYRNQPADVRFVLDAVLEMNEHGGELEGLVATDHMGISGLSLGGATAYPTLFHSCCADERYVSAVLMSALELPFEPGSYDYGSRRPFPVLAFAGTSDDAVPYDLQQSVIAKLPGPTWNVTLLDGEHSAPFENFDAEHDEAVVAATLDFWAQTLRGDTEAGQRIVDDATVPGIASVVFTP